MSAPAAQIGVTGLAVMGRNLARNLARHGYTVAVHNRSYAKTASLVADHGDEGTFVPSVTTEEFVASLERPRKVIIMVKAGGPTDAVIDELVPLLDEGDIVIDAGNAHFPDTRRREAARKAKGLHFVGTGGSGGEEGALNGPSIMPGGSRESYAVLGPILEDISAKVDGTPCCTYVGPDGAGHVVKMVHNGIEYADMQLIAEATFARALSGSVPQRTAAVGTLPAHATAFDVTDRDAFIEDVRLALYASKVVAYSQGFDQIAAASAENDWAIDRGAMARIWRGGCIIRARFLNRITEAYERDADLPLLLADEYFTGAVGNGVQAWRRVVSQAALAGVPTPAFSSSLAYYDGVRAERLPASLIQAQRDFFGAHTYRRTDREGTFHTDWSGDRAEHTA